jgi:hypothetical protein
VCRVVAFAVAMIVTCCGSASASTWEWYQQVSQAAKRDHGSEVLLQGYLVGAADAFRLMTDIMKTRTGQTGTICIQDSLIVNASVAKQVLDAGEQKYIKDYGAKVPGTMPLVILIHQGFEQVFPCR